MRAPRLTIPRPRPAPHVTMVLRQPVKELAGQGHHGGRLVAEVLVIRLEGPDGQEVPQDVVGLTTTDFPLMGEEHELHLSFPIKLEAPRDPEPPLEGIGAAAALDGGPTRREGFPDPQEVPVLLIREVVVVVLLDGP